MLEHDLRELTSAVDSLVESSDIACAVFEALAWRVLELERREARRLDDRKKN